MATEKAYPSFQSFPTIGRPNITYVAQDTGYKYIFNQGYKIVSGSAKQINGKKPQPQGTTDLTASDIDALPNTATLTINGTTKQLSTNPTFTIVSDVTSVDGRTGDVYTANGIISPEAAVLSINTDNTKFDVAAGTGVIDNEFFSWDEQLAITPIYLATSTLTHVYVAADGSIFQSDIEPTPQLRRQYLYLGQLGHTNFTTIQTAVNVPEVFAQTDQQFRDLLACFGILNCNGNIVSANGANLKIDVSAGDLYGSGINWETDGADNPNDRHFVSLTAPFFRRRTQTGNGVVADTVDVANYDNAGTITAIVGTKYQNQRVYRLISGNIVVQYGQVLYNSLAVAIEGLNNEAYIEFPNVTKIGALIGFISVGSNCTSLQDTSRARIYTTSKIGGASVPPNIDGSGTANEIAYWVDADTLGSLTTATYPSLTELSYVKGVTSPIQTQLDKEKTLDLWVGSSTTTNGTETILRTIPITANDVANLDIVWISCQVSTTQTSGNITTRIRVGTSAVPANITLETELINGGVTASAGGAYSPINNYIAFNGGNIISVLRAFMGASAAVQMFSSVSPPLNATWYIYITTTKAAAGTISLTSSIIKRDRA